ncbi:hypothetical protein [Rummeliibacillus stabekisii]|uniref:hypothetical protein n=1 Tax=Rummeliibacillus stabekisii TaxID=241244 RepID=UPI00116E0807|nr:hypothetical protein [Rummeliibacillus stabekisii]MBB5171619.1 hypothetical protein [Rummeliibacillus stabekisii]GEL05466.1 hypothetical protein RST01_20930 [Rummeliibacillus stabekisii]
MTLKVIDTLNHQERIQYNNTINSLDKEKTLFGVLFFIVKARLILFKAKRRYQKSQRGQFNN